MQGGGRNQERLPRGNDIKIYRMLQREMKESTSGSNMYKDNRKDGIGRIKTRGRVAVSL
jgi:hypothetical protein